MMDKKMKKGMGEMPMMKDKKHKKESEKMMKGMGKIMSHMPKGGTLSPKGDLGVLRQEETRRVGGFGGTTVNAAAYFKKG